jgi:hypothetical protein
MIANVTIQQRNSCLPGHLHPDVSFASPRPWF